MQAVRQVVGRQASRQADIHTGRQSMMIDRQAGRQVGRQARQAGLQAGRQAGR